MRDEGSGTSVGERAEDRRTGSQLLTGDAVAWVMKSGGRTCGVSAIHRVFEDGKTYCLRHIPDEERQFPPLRSLNVCSRCEALYQRASKHAAHSLKAS